MAHRRCLALLGALLLVSAVSAVNLERMSLAAQLEDEQVNVPITVLKPQIQGDLSASAQVGATHFAANLASQSFGDSTESMTMDSFQQTPPDANAPPLTLEATPLEGGDDGSASGSSSGSGSSGSFSGSSSGSSGSSGSGSESEYEGESSGPTPLRCNPAAGPCGGGGALREAKIVAKLGGNGKKFSTVLPSQKDIWFFDDGTARPMPQKPDAPEVLAIQNSDPELAALKEKLDHIVDKMDQEKGWIEDVQMIIAHYRQKAGAVAAGLKNEANQVKNLHALITARKKMAARKALENKLLKVNTQLQQLQHATSSVTGEAKSLMSLKSNLNKSIQSIQNEIEHLRSAK